MKEKIKEWLTEWNHEYKDMGALSYNKNDDYPDFIKKAAQEVAKDPKNSRGIILGGSGQGEAMAANRFKGVRAAVYYGRAFADNFPSGHSPDDSDTPDTIVRLSREHNDSNVLSLGAAFINMETAKRVIKLWLDTPFSNDERHIRRMQKLDE